MVGATGKYASTPMSRYLYCFHSAWAGTEASTVAASPRATKRMLVLLFPATAAMNPAQPAGSINQLLCHLSIRARHLNVLAVCDVTAWLYAQYLFTMHCAG